MPHLPLNIPPGVVSYGTKYQARGRWCHAHGVRWHGGVMHPIGGWAPADTPQPVATVRHMHAWENKVAIASETNLFLTGATHAGTFRSLDNFGTDLLAINGSNKLCHFGTGAAVSSAPDAKALVVTPERFVLLIGADNVANKVAWADQESLTDWDFMDPNNQAGTFELQAQGTLLAGRRTRGETLLWTTEDLWSMRYIGLPLVYAFQQLGRSCGAISDKSMVTVDAGAYWMGSQGFYKYDGFVQALPSEVGDYVFRRLNRNAAHRVFAMTVSRYNEVWWFYPAGTSAENTSYVAYNYVENHWMIGELGRTAGVDRSPYPLMSAMAYPSVLHHELPMSGGGEWGSLPDAFIESGPVELGDGDNVMHVRRLIPDEKTLGETRVKFFAAQTPTSAETMHGPFTLASNTDVRFCGRQVRVRIEQVAADWRVGVPRLEVVPGGLR
jgi:hypothetical protein